MAQTIEIKIPDIGDFKDVPVIEVMVKPGDTVQAEDPIVTLETDKAAMEVPSPNAGTVKDMKVKVGDKVSQGSLLMLLETAEQTDTEAATSTHAPPSKAEGQGGSALSAAEAPKTPPAAQPAPSPAREPEPSAELSPVTGVPPAPGQIEEPMAPPPVVLMPGPADMVAAVVGGQRSHASPSVRRFARELGVDISKLKGSGPKGRILKEDVQAYVKTALGAARPAAGGALDLLPWPKVDFSKFGPVEMQALSRIKKLSGSYLARNWVMIPHVTQFDEADATELEEFRVAINKEQEKKGVKVTILAFLIKASVAALKKFPQFNSSLDGENLVIKHYYHIGFAADTPHGLVVPVVKDADKKSVLDIAREAAELAKKARDGKLAPTEMQGGSFSISSLGGIGGTAFTPIINAPEVAILGVSKAETKPKWNGSEFVPRLMLPLSLSYDHRVVDGASAARFITRLGQVLADMRRAML